MIQVATDPIQVRELCDAFRSEGKRVGIVPTMGALHKGHLSLVDTVRSSGAQCVVVTIFVNPTQFGPQEDFSRYPRTFQADIELCREHSVDLVFHPEVETLYPSGFQTYVTTESISTGFEGSYRPNHFQGVTTIVTKLFNIVGPCVAAFGRKDYQQWRVIETMAHDLNMPIEVIGSAIIREPDGLAMSSRNRYLTDEERLRALSIYQGLLAVQESFSSGEREVKKLLKIMYTHLESRVDNIEYVSIANPKSLIPCESHASDKAVVLVAVRLGSTRLLDNTILGENDLSCP